MEVPNSAPFPAPEGMVSSETAAYTHPETCAPSAEAPVSVAGYEILGELGRGGMGVVYKARQLGLNRLVALKMILAGPHAGTEELARFRLEAEAVARLQHPNIIQIYEVGEWRAGGPGPALPYFSLELIEGTSLDRRLAGTPLAAHQAAELVETLARAVHAAHQRCIIHRDLKPANILFTADGTPKITDFGLAKQLDSEKGQTRSGAIMGTPSYMAPEQAGGRKEISPATDVYALGAILYEVLTGRPPFRAATALDTVLQVVSEEPVPPCRLQPNLPPDLETICLKCVEKEPAKRYVSALALAEDLRRFLAGEPTHARPASSRERVVKWARRRPAVATLVGVSITFLLTLIIVGLAYQNRLRDSNMQLQEALAAAENQRDAATRATSEAQREHERAEAHLHKALEAVDRMLTKVGDERLANLPQFEDLRRQVLEEALGFYRDFLRQESNDPSVRRETARALSQMATVHFLLGQSAQAEEKYQEAVRLQEKLVADFPSTPEYRHDLCQSLDGLGALYTATVRFERAASSYGKALLQSEQLVKAHPDNPKYVESLANTHVYLGYSRGVTAPSDAESHLREAIKLVEQLTFKHPASDDYQCLLAGCCSALGRVLLNMDRSSEAEQMLCRGEELLQPSSRDAPRTGKDYLSALAINQTYLGILYARTARLEQAERSLAQGIADYERLPQSSKHFFHRFQIAMAYQALAEVYTQRKRLPQAEEAWGKGVARADLLAREFPSFPWLTAYADRMRAQRMIFLVRQGEVTKTIREAKTLAEKKDLPGDVYYNLACVYALSSAAMKGEGQLSEDYALWALRLLNLADRAGQFRNRAAIEHAKTDQDLLPLRERKDFQELLQGFEAKVETGKANESSKKDG